MIILKNDESIQLVQGKNSELLYIYKGEVIFSSKNNNAEAIIAAVEHANPTCSKDALIAQNAMLRLRGDEICNKLLTIATMSKNQDLKDLANAWYNDSTQPPHYSLSYIHTSIALFLQEHNMKK